MGWEHNFFTHHTAACSLALDAHVKNMANCIHYQYSQRAWPCIPSMPSCCAASSADTTLNQAEAQQVAEKVNLTARVRSSISSTFVAPWRSLFERESVYYEDQLIKWVTTMGMDMVTFACMSGTGNRVLGFWCAVLISIWASCSCIYDMLTLTFNSIGSDLLVMVVGLIFATLEYKILLLPAHVMKFIESDVRFILKPHSRSAIYLFCSAYIATISSHRLCIEGAASSTKEEAFESVVLGCILMLTSTLMLYRSFFTYKELEHIMEENLDMDGIMKRFHDHEMCNDGTFQSNEFIAFLASVNIYLPHDRLNDLMCEVDPNHTGTVHYYDFVSWYKNFLTMAIYVNLLRMNVGLPVLYHVPGVI